MCFVYLCFVVLVFVDVALQYAVQYFAFVCLFLVWIIVVFALHFVCNAFITRVATTSWSRVCMLWRLDPMFAFEAGGVDAGHLHSFPLVCDGLSCGFVMHDSCSLLWIF